ncbi:pectate lyase, partial [Dickeya dadantii]|nr:pectate lyase [Dickeya dadantii]
MNNTRVSSVGTKSLLAAIIATSMMTWSVNAATLQTTKATEAASTGWATQGG